MKKRQPKKRHEKPVHKESVFLMAKLQIKQYN